MTPRNVETVQAVVVAQEEQKKNQNSLFLSLFAEDGTPIDLSGGGGGGGSVAWSSITGKPAVIAAGADAATARGAIGLGDSATHPASDFAPANAFDKLSSNVIYLADYPAVSGDYTQAWKDAFADAITAAQAGTNLTIIEVPGIEMPCDGAPVTGAPTHGNAIIPIPIVDTADAKVTILVRGPGPASALPHWLQTVSQKTGAVVKVTRTDGTDDPSNGPASVFGGPTLEAGWGAHFDTPWNNVRIIFQNINIQLPVNSSYCGFDMSACAEAGWFDCAVFTDAPPSDQDQGAITRQWTFGFRPPLVNNNAIVEYHGCSCEGLTTGFFVTEHTYADRITALYCIVGINMRSGDGVSSPHGAFISYAVAEQCGVGLGVFNDGAFKFRVAHLDTEANGHCIQDTNNLGRGEIYVTGDGVDVNGGQFIKVIDGNDSPGAFTPSIPASTISSDPLYRDTEYYITSGSVTDVTVDGHSLGTPSQFKVPSGKLYSLTYSSAPTLVGIKS